MNLPFEKEYIKGSKNSGNTKTISFKLQNDDVDFLKEFHFHLLKKEGFHKLAFTRTDLLHHALDLFIEKYSKDIMDSKNVKLIELIKKRKN